eukprot:6574049-Alexandrium_andersonii.AAC.1
MCIRDRLLAARPSAGGSPCGAARWGSRIRSIAFPRAAIAAIASSRHPSAQRPISRLGGLAVSPPLLSRRVRMRRTCLPCQAEPPIRPCLATTGPL